MVHIFSLFKWEPNIAERSIIFIFINQVEIYSLAYDYTLKPHILMVLVKIANVLTILYLHIVPVIVVSYL